MGWIDAHAVLEHYSKHQIDEEIRIARAGLYANKTWPPCHYIGRLSLAYSRADQTLFPVYSSPIRGPVIFAPGGVRLLADTKDETPQAYAPGQAPGDAPAARPSRTPADSPAGTQVRRLTDDGLRRAREFLAYMREHPGANREPPRELLFGEHYSRLFRESLRVERRAFQTRREAAEYFEPKLATIRHLVTDDARLWSWLGMFYFADTVRVENGQVRLSPLDETFVVHREDSRSYMLRFRHYLWGTWRLYETHGESVAFLLDQNLTAFGDIFQRTFGAIRIFNSDGIIQLVLRLYTHDTRQKRGFGHAPGGLRHLLRVLDQLERTYDVYGMSPDALIKVLPEEFRHWDSQSAPAALNGAASPDPVASVAIDPGDEGFTASVRGELVEPQAEGQAFGQLRAGSVEPNASLRPSAGSGRTEAPSDSPSVRQTLLNIRTTIEQQGQVSWADPREHLEEGSEAWKAYVAVCGVPERRLFRTVFLYRLDEALTSLD